MKINSDSVITLFYSFLAIAFFIAYYQRIIKKYTDILKGAQHAINGRFKLKLFKVVGLNGEYKNRKVVLEVDPNYFPTVKVKLNKNALDKKMLKAGGFLDPSYLLSNRLLEDEDNFVTILDELSYICEKIEKGEFVINPQNPKNSR